MLFFTAFNATVYETKMKALTLAQLQKNEKKERKDHSPTERSSRAVIWFLLVMSAMRS